MRFLMLYTIGIVFLVSNTYAERWILKNPRSIPIGVQVIKRLQFATINYVVVTTVDSAAESASTSANRAQTLALASGADSVFQDPKIGVPARGKGDGGPDGWHVRKLRYGNIPQNLDGRGIIVAVLDTGVDYHHPALAAHIWKNRLEIPGNNKDDDGNGYKDDVVGYDFVERDNDPSDLLAHGTHCAGIIAANWNPEGNSRGIARGVQIMPVKILEGQEFLSTAVEGIRYAVDNGAKVLSNSWGIYKSWNYYYDEEGRAMLAEAIRYAAQNKAVFVAASGNNTLNLNNPYDPFYPGGMRGHANMIVVGATNFEDQIANFSNYGNAVVHVAAPGDGILSTWPGGSWVQMSGTSMAAPIVAGLLAIGLQKGYGMYGSIDRLVKTSRKIPGFEAYFKSRGIIDPISFLK